MADKFHIDTTHLQSIDKLDTGKVWVLKDLPGDAFFTIGKVAIDWDGDPMAYGNKFSHPDIHPHDKLGNAGHAGNWWGVVTNTGTKHGTPVEQSGVGPAQPYQNYMISTTKLVDNTYPSERDVRHWADATQIPFVALPNSRNSMRTIGLKPGCYCLLVDLQTMKYCFGIYADSKAATPRMGEISKRAADLLGNTNGSGSVFILAFPRSGQGQGIIPNEQTIQARGREELKLFSWTDDGDHLMKALIDIFPLNFSIIQAGYHTNLGDLQLI